MQARVTSSPDQRTAIVSYPDEKIGLGDGAIAVGRICPGGMYSNKSMQRLHLTDAL